MSTILFGGTVSLISSATPSSGYIVGYDTDGILKQKDQFGVITEIGGGPTAGNTGTASLLQVLQIGNETGTNSIIMGTSTSILSSNGNSQISLDDSGNSNNIFISNFNATSSSDIRINSGNISIQNVIGNTSSTTTFGNNSLVSQIGTNTIFTRVNLQQNVFDLTFNRTSLLDGTISLIKGGSTYDSGSLNKAFLHINTINSTTNNGVQNSVIIGGDGLNANESNSVYVPQLVIKNGDVIKSSQGTNFFKFTEDNDSLIVNSSNNSVIGLLTSTSSYNTYNGILLIDTSTGSYTPNVQSVVSALSTENSYISSGLLNTVIIGGVGLSASQNNTVYLGNSVNINNAYTLPNTDGSSGQVLKTDGLGNVTWQTDSTTASIAPLSQVLLVGNNSGTSDIIMGTNTSLKSARGGGQINLDLGPNEVVISTDNANFIAAYLELNNNDITIDSSNGGLNILTGDSVIVTGNGEGLKYGFDYSSGFVTYSLVNKGYVDSYVNAGTASIWNEINTNLISGVTAGRGLSGGGSFGDVTLDINLGQNSGLTFSGDNIIVDTNIAGNGLDFTNGVLSVDTSEITGTLGGKGLTANGSSLDVNVNSDSLEILGDVIRLKDIITGDRQFSDSVTIGGNLTISGTATFVNTEELFVSDSIITLLATYSSGTPFLDSGIEILRGGSQSASLLWNETIDYWQVGLSGSESTIITEAGSGLIKSNNELSVDFGTVSSISYVNSVITSASNFANTNLTLTGSRTHTIPSSNTLYLGQSSYVGPYLYLGGTNSGISNDYTLLGYSNNYIDVDNDHIINWFNLVNRYSILSSETVINENGGNYDFRIEGDTDTNLFFVDASTDRIGIGNNTPLYKLQVTGTVSTTGFRMTDGAQDGYILQSDASGNASWVLPSTGISGTGSNNYITKWNGTSSISDSSLYTIGERLYIGSTSSPQDLLDWQQSIYTSYSGPSKTIGVSGFYSNITGTSSNVYSFISSISTQNNASNNGFYSIIVATGSDSAYGVRVDVKGSDTNYGISSVVTGTSGDNYGLVIDSNNGVNNYGIIVLRGTSIFNQNNQNYDFIVEGMTESNLFYVDASNDAVGIATNTPGADFEVNGFTKLGSDAPAVKTKLIELTTPASGVGLATQIHSITGTIIGYTIVCEAVDNKLIIPYTPASSIANSYYTAYVTTTSVSYGGDFTTNSNVASSPLRFYITYIE